MKDSTAYQQSFYKHSSSCSQPTSYVLPSSNTLANLLNPQKQQKPTHQISNRPSFYDLQEVVSKYQSQPELLKLILNGKLEEDKRRTEEAKLRAKELDLYLQKCRHEFRSTTAADGPLLDRSDSTTSCTSTSGGGGNNVGTNCGPSSNNNQNHNYNHNHNHNQNHNQKHNHNHNNAAATMTTTTNGQEITTNYIFTSTSTSISTSTSASTPTSTPTFIGPIRRRKSSSSSDSASLQNRNTPYSLQHSRRPSASNHRSVFRAPSVELIAQEERRDSAAEAMVAMGSLFIVNGKSDSTASPNLSTASSPPHTHHTPHISHTQHTSPPPPPPPIQSAFSPFNPQPENRHHHRSSSSSNNNIISHTHSRNHSHSHSRSHSNGQSYSYNYNQSQTQNQNQNYHQQYETDPPIKMLTKDILLQPNFDRHSSRRKREMQAVTKIVETREFPYNDNYFWKNNGNTTHKKNGCRSIYYKCSNSSKGCSVNKTVAAKEDGYYVIKYRGEHQKECGHVEHIRDL